MITNILFDFFGVICDEIAPVWFGKHFTPAEAAEIKDRIFVRADRGDISESQTYKEISAITGISAERIMSEWNDLIRIDGRVLDYIADIKKSYPVYLLSNAISPFLRNILRQYDLYRLFDGIYISSEIHLIKPSREFFGYVLDDLGISGDKAVMIDDNPSNISGAGKVGIKGIVYENENQLKAEMNKFGIII